MLYTPLHRIKDILFIEDVNLLTLTEQFGTPLYVYSRATLEKAYNDYTNACKGYCASIFYAVKANSNLTILSTLACLGSGFDIVSGGELARVLKINGNPKKIVFSGVGKTIQEISSAIEAGINCFNVESISELERLAMIAKSYNKCIPISLRINPDIETSTHPYISTGLKNNKFGIAYDLAIEAYHKAASSSSINVIGIDCHIGSQITEISPYIKAIDKILLLVEILEKDGIFINHIDIGGGLGICYNTNKEKEKPPKISVFVKTILNYFVKRGHGHRKILFEPGRSIVGSAGFLLTKIEYIKTSKIKNFAIVDAAMNDLIRPTMYNSYHTIEEVKQNATIPAENYDIVGPVCESGDWFGQNRTLKIKQGDMLIIHDVGAYGFVMSSNYNSRTRPAEVMIDGSQVHIIRQRETISDLYFHENIQSNYKLK